MVDIDHDDAALHGGGAVLIKSQDMTHILLTNDDGIQAVGLRTLREAVEGLGTISIVAPSREQSGAAQSLTLRQPIVCHEVAEREWAIDGTPADCVIVEIGRAHV